MYYVMTILLLIFLIADFKMYVLAVFKLFKKKKLLLLISFTDIIVNLILNCELQYSIWYLDTLISSYMDPVTLQ